MFPHRLAIALLILALTACAGIAPPVDETAPVECGFPEDTELIYAEHTTLDEIGLSGTVRGDAAGMVYVTSEAVSTDGDAEAARQFCIRFDRPQGGATEEVGPVPADWLPE